MDSEKEDLVVKPDIKENKRFSIVIQLTFRD
jgi:hypothetical protein